jgi:hypothetical protein
LSTPVSLQSAFCRNFKVSKPVRNRYQGCVRHLLLLIRYHGLQQFMMSFTLPSVLSYSLAQSPNHSVDVELPVFIRVVPLSIPDVVDKPAVSTMSSKKSGVSSPQKSCPGWTAAGLLKMDLSPEDRALESDHKHREHSMTGSPILRALRKNILAKTHGRYCANAECLQNGWCLFPAGPASEVGSAEDNISGIDLAGKIRPYRFHGFPLHFLDWFDQISGGDDNVGVNPIAEFPYAPFYSHLEPPFSSTGL